MSDVIHCKSFGGISDCLKNAWKITLWVSFNAAFKHGSGRGEGLAVIAIASESGQSSFYKTSVDVHNYRGIVKTGSSDCDLRDRVGDSASERSE